MNEIFRDTYFKVSIRSKTHYYQVMYVCHISLNISYGILKKLTSHALNKHTVRKENFLFEMCLLERPPRRALHL